VALVTGAGRGLGRAIAVDLAGAGASVALVSRSIDQLEETAAQIRGANGQALVLAADATEDGAAERAVAATVAHFGKVDILVVSAGTATTRPSLEVTPQEWDQVLDLNLRAAFFWSQAAGRVMSKAGGGRIIYLASINGVIGMPRVAAYGASKGGLINLARTLAVEWSRYGITVNAIAPGYVKTAMNEDALTDQRVMNYITQRTPMRRLGTLAEVASAAVYLASDAASFVTGHVLAVDGGWLAS